MELHLSPRQANGIEHKRLSGKYGYFKHSYGYNTVETAVLNKIITVISIKIHNKIDILLKMLKQVIPPHLLYEIYISFLKQKWLISTKMWRTVSIYIDSDHTEVEDLSSICMNESHVCDRCGHDTRQLHPSCTACTRTANLPGLA